MGVEKALVNLSLLRFNRIEGVLMIRLLPAVLLFASFDVVAEECPGFSPAPNAPTKCDLNQLNNDEVADADKVMENFNTLGDAIDVVEANSNFIYRETRGDLDQIVVTVYCTDEYPIAVSGTCIQPNTLSRQAAVAHKLNPISSAGENGIVPGSYSCHWDGPSGSGQVGVLCTKGSLKSWCQVDYNTGQETCFFSEYLE